jgi:putative peptidoglycan lipid II flippase
MVSGVRAVDEQAPAGRASRSATYIGSFALAGRLLERLAAFGLIVLVASVYGTGLEADVYFAASIVPLMIGSIGGEALAASLLPALVRRTRGDVGLLSAGFWLVTAVIAAASLAYVLVLIPLAEWRFAGEYGRLAPWLAFVPIAFGAGLSAYFGAVLLQYERYVWPAFRSGAAALAALLLTASVLLATDDLTWIAASVSAGYVVALVLLLAEVVHVAGARWLRPPSRADIREALTVWSNATAGFTGGLLGGQVFVLLERALAATFSTGAIAMVSYARGVAFTPNVIGQAVSAAVYPEMVRAHEADDREHVVTRFFQGLRLTLFTSIAFAALFALFGPNLIGFFLQRGQFGGATTDDVGRVLSAFALALVGSMLIILASRVFYSTDFFRGMTVVQAAALLVYAAAAFPLRAAWGVSGLAAAFSVAQLAAGALAVVLVVRRLEIEPWKVFRRGILPGLRLGLRVAFALVLFRLVVETRWIEVPQAWRGVVMVGGSVLVLAFTCGKALWESGWPESQRLKDAVWKLVLATFRR